MHKTARAAVVSCVAPLLLAGGPRPFADIQGTVLDDSGQPVAGALVTARSEELKRGVATTTDENGRYRLPSLPQGRYKVDARKFGYAMDYLEVDFGQASEIALDFTLSRTGESEDPAPSSMLLSLLPEGETKRRFKLDCTGCHQFNGQIVEQDGQIKSRAAWVERTDQMLSFAGAETQFPIMSPSRDSGTTADWLVASLGEPGDRLPPPTQPASPASLLGKAVITEYDLPGPDLPHDVMVAPDGEILVTGMFTHQMYKLDPETGQFSTEPIPVPGANPRALDIAEDGSWWILLGAPRQIAHFDPRGAEWKMFSLGMYPHSVALDGEGRVWFNGHFTKNPELIGYLDPRSGTTTTFEVPTEVMPDGGSNIPYGLRVAGDGTVWATQLVGNRLIRFEPERERFRLYRLPSAHSGPRRPDVASDGSVWIPEYAANKLAKFDPKTESFTEYDFPIPDALPYVVRVDERRGTVWIGTAAADVVASFDPETETFRVYPLPTRGALTRHIDIDSSSGMVWGAYSPAPVVNPRVFSLKVLP